MDFNKKTYFLVILGITQGLRSCLIKIVSKTLLQNRIFGMFHHATLWGKNKVTQYYPASQFFSRVFNKLE